MVGSLLSVTIVLMAMVTLPLKAAAHVAGARNASMGACALAAVVGLSAGYLATVLIGSAIGGPLAAALGFSLAIRLVLGTTLIGAIGLMIVALGMSLIGTWILAQLGLLGVEGPSA